MAKPVVFFSRCKPQGVDAIELVRKVNRVFIGYPMHRPRTTYDPKNLKACVVDPTCSDEEWDSAKAALPKAERSLQYQKNRNFVRNIGVGSIAMVPRPEKGIVYCGRVISDFELVDAPPWFDQYMTIRRKYNPDDNDFPEDGTWHAADVAQGWKVDKFRPISLPIIPAWIRHSLYGRSTYGVLWPWEPAGDPYADVMNPLLDNPDQWCQPRQWTSDVEVIKKRLLWDISPSALEHLAVSILQLENHDEKWLFVGGPGDGGVDGIGLKNDGQLVGALQCKWSFNGQLVLANIKAKKKYLACLYGSSSDGGYEFWGADEIARLVLKHCRQLPEALTLRVRS